MTASLQGSANTAPPYTPAATDEAELGAIHALMRGEATKGQQLQFVEWLIKATGFAEMSYRPTDRDTAFAEGKRFVGLQFFSLGKTRIERK